MSFFFHQLSYLFLSLNSSLIFDRAERADYYFPHLHRHSKLQLAIGNIYQFKLVYWKQELFDKFLLSNYFT